MLSIECHIRMWQNKPDLRNPNYEVSGKNSEFEIFYLKICGQDEFINFWQIWI